MSKRPPPVWLAPVAPPQKRAARDTNTYEGRVVAIGQGAQDLLAGRMPPRAQVLLIAGGIAAWLEGRSGAKLERDYWRVTKPKSRFTPQRMWREHKNDCSAPNPEPTVAPLQPTKGHKP